MGTTALRQLLMSLCNNSHWDYAVFWKLKHQTPPILAWEDGYSDHPKPIQSLESAPKDIYFNETKKFISICNTSVRDTSSSGYTLGLAMAEMSGLQYALGEGTVGRVANTGSHSWISFNSLFTRQSEPKLVSDWPEEWLLQFALGIKTILLVPVLPDGVLQLGSLQAVAEDPTVITLVKDRFNSFCNVNEKNLPCMLWRNIQAKSLLSSPSCGLTEGTNEPLGLLISSLKPEELEYIGGINKIENSFSTLCQPVLSISVGDMLPVSEKDVINNFESTGDYNTSLTEESTLPIGSMHGNRLEMVDDHITRLSCLEEELLAHSLSSFHNMRPFGESFHAVEDSAAQHLGDNISNISCYESTNNFFNFPDDIGPHKEELGASFQEENKEHVWDSSILIEEDAFNNSSFICNRNLSDIMESSRFFKDSDISYGLNDVINSCDVPSRQFVVSCPQVEEGAWIENCLGPQNIVKSPVLSGDKVSTSFNNSASTLINKDLQFKDHSYPQPRKGRKLSNVNKNKARVGNNQKPRPRDRQLIQDRVKELRELIPNGFKYSIDGLLHRTIKHVMHLQSVTNHAEKTKQYLHQEVSNCKNWKSSENNEGFLTGASLAFELESVLPKCPIVVENLNFQGHMIVEMLCEEHGLFFEIAQVIKDLELTILKGAMETRSSGLWAHFIVEASKGLHRMEILCPLLYLLHRRRMCSSKI